MKKDIGIERYLIKHYSKMLIKNPRSFIFLPLANSFKRRGNPEAAIEICQNGLKNHPHYTSGRALLGELYFHCKKYSEAEKELKIVADSSPKHLTARKLLIEIYLNKGMTAEATEIEEEIVDICSAGKTKRHIRNDIKKHIESYNRRTEKKKKEAEPLLFQAENEAHYGTRKGEESMIDDRLAFKEIGNLFSKKERSQERGAESPNKVKQLSIFESMLSKIENGEDES